MPKKPNPKELPAKAPSEAVNKSIARHQAKEAKKLFGGKGKNLSKVNKIMDDIFGKSSLVLDYISSPAARRASEKRGVQPKWKPGFKPQGSGRKG